MGRRCPTHECKVNHNFPIINHLAAIFELEKLHIFDFWLYLCLVE